MWIFDRSRTTYSDSVDKFMAALKLEKANKVLEELSLLLNVSLESAKNTYATPIFHLGVGYKVEIGKYLFGKTDISPSDLQLSNIEYRYTEPALLLASGKITKETFLLINIIRFQVLNPTLERNRFNQRINNKVLPLLLTLQTLKGLEKYDPNEAYLTESDLGWLYQKTDHENIQEIVNQILDHRTNGTPPPPHKYSDAFFNLFDATGVVIKRVRVSLRGVWRKILVLAANRSMVVDNILADPPEFFPITWDDRWKWAQYYASLPPRIERFFPPKEPFVYKARLPAQTKFEPSSKNLTVPAVFASTLKENDLVVWENPVEGLFSNVIYKIQGEPSFLANGEAIIQVAEAYRSLDPSINLQLEF